MTTSNTTPLTVEELTALLTQAREAEKLVEQATAKRYSGLGTEMLTSIVDENNLTYSKSSGWAGISVNGLPVEGGYTANLTITHTAETERRKPIFALAKKDADTAKLTGDERKKFIAERLVASEPVKADA